MDRWLSPDGVPLLLLAIVVALAALGSTVALIWPHAPESGRPARRSICRRARSGARRRHRDGGRYHRREAERADGFAPAVIGRAIACLRALDVSEVVLPRALRRACRSGRAWRGRASYRVHFRGPVCGARAGGRAAALPAGHDRHLGSPGDVRMAAGRPLRIVARLDGRGGTLTHVTPTLAVESNGQVRTIAMQPGDDGYAVTINRVDRSFGYRVRAGRAASRLRGDRAVSAARAAHRAALRLSVVQRAEAARRDATAATSTGRPARACASVVHTDKPIVNGSLAFSEGKTGVVAGARRTIGRSSPRSPSRRRRPTAWPWSMPTV